MCVHVLMETRNQHQHFPLSFSTTHTHTKFLCVCLLVICVPCACLQSPEDGASSSGVIGGSEPPDMGVRN